MSAVPYTTITPPFCYQSRWMAVAGWWQSATMVGMNTSGGGGKVVSLRMPADLAAQVADSRPTGLSLNAWLLTLLRRGLGEEVEEPPRTVLASVRPMQPEDPEPPGPPPVPTGLTGAAVVQPPPVVAKTNGVKENGARLDPADLEPVEEVPEGDPNLPPHRHRPTKTPIREWHERGQHMVQYACVDCGTPLAPRVR